MELTKYEQTRMQAAQLVLDMSIEDHDDALRYAHHVSTLEVHLEAMIQLVESLTSPNLSLANMLNRVMEGGWSATGHKRLDDRFEVVLAGPRAAPAAGKAKTSKRRSPAQSRWQASNSRRLAAETNKTAPDPERGGLGM